VVTPSIDGNLLTIDTNGNRPDRHPRTANSAGQQTGRGRFTAPWTQ
jgi:hypothetical protein